LRFRPVEEISRNGQKALLGVLNRLFFGQCDLADMVKVVLYDPVQQPLDGVLVTLVGHMVVQTRPVIFRDRIL
jgi:hypothetical protein